MGRKLKLACAKWWRPSRLSRLSRISFNPCNYNTSKAALAAYVRSLGREIADTGVIVTGVLPGAFLAPNNAFVRLRENNPEVYKNFVQERLPRKRIGQANEIIPLLLYLSSEAASMMSGCCVPIDAGE